jgi:hypothetical protein
MASTASAASSEHAARLLLAQRLVDEQVRPYLEANATAARALKSLQQLPVRRKARAIELRATCAGHCVAVSLLARSRCFACCIPWD